MRVRILPAAVIAAATIFGTVLITAQQGTSGSKPSLEGAWKVSEIKYTGPNARTVTSPQPGILTFTSRHFSNAIVMSDTPRPAAKEPPPPGPARDKVIADNALAFNASGGSYETKGNMVTFHLDVNLNPSNMGPGRFSEFTIRFEGNDTFSLTQTRTGDGPVANPTTFKFTRLK